ncbi:hypothetical protein H2203_005092 [Taxawa tesnikishii (nom. ined.)]|nr:hypothetical protein H2203_005092 [Dothideales sp. JES 119]
MATTPIQAYGTAQNESHSFPWPNFTNVKTVMCEGQDITPRIHAKVEKGFFLSSSDRSWTCYRRNYFSVACSFELHPYIANGRLSLEGRLVQATGIRLTAVTDGHEGKAVELVQHTPKRDQGPKTEIMIQKIAPTAPSGRTPEQTISPHHVYQVPIQTFHHTGTVPSPYLPLQNTRDPSSSPSDSSRLSSPTFPYSSGPNPSVPAGQNQTHTFERVQFKSATASNGKRRASQQYFHLKVELYVDVRAEGAEKPHWEKIAYKVSEKIVVRGRSPSHYQHEGGHNGAGRSGSNAGSSSSHYGHAGSSYRDGGFGNGSNTFGNASGGASNTGGFRPTQHIASPSASGASSSASSISGGIALDTKHPMEAEASSSEDAAMHGYEGYQYYPSTLYEGMPVPSKAEAPVTLPGLAYMDEGPGRISIKEEYPNATPGAEYARAGGCGRFQGVETSRGYFPDLHINGY